MRSYSNHCTYKSIPSTPSELVTIIILIFTSEIGVEPQFEQTQAVLSGSKIHATCGSYYKPGWCWLLLGKIIRFSGEEVRSHYIFYNICTMLYNKIAKHKRILTHTHMLFNSLNKVLNKKTLSILSKRNFKNLYFIKKQKHMMPKNF